jgi:hypothetical protein
MLNLFSTVSLICNGPVKFSCLGSKIILNYHFKSEPSENKLSIKKHLKEKTNLQQINTVHQLVMGDPPFFLALPCQPLEPAGPTNSCTSALLPF